MSLVVNPPEMSCSDHISYSHSCEDNVVCKHVTEMCEYHADFKESCDSTVSHDDHYVKTSTQPYVEFQNVSASWDLVSVCLLNRQTN